MGKFCTSCGNRLDEGVNVCPSCGKEVKVEEVEAEKVETETQTTTSTSTTNTTQNTTSAPKSKIAAGLLGIFLGAFGVHNFYLGYTGKAIGQLLLTILSCGILSFASGIWGLIEGILILTGSIDTDANGVKLSD